MLVQLLDNVSQQLFPKITRSSIPDGAVNSNKIEDGAVNSDKILNNSISTDKMQDDSVSLIITFILPHYQPDIFTEAWLDDKTYKWSNSNILSTDKIILDLNLENKDYDDDELENLLSEYSKLIAIFPTAGGITMKWFEPPLMDLPIKLIIFRK